MFACSLADRWPDSRRLGAQERALLRQPSALAAPRPGGYGRLELAADRAFARAAAWLSAAAKGAPVREALAARGAATLRRPQGRLRTDSLCQVRPRFLDEVSAFEGWPLGATALAERALAGCAASGDHDAAAALRAMRLAPLRCYWVGSAIRRGCAWLYPLDDAGQLGPRCLVDVRAAAGICREGLVFGRVAVLPEGLLTQGMARRLSGAALAFGPGDHDLVLEALRLTAGASRWPLRVIGLFGLLAVRRSGVCHALRPGVSETGPLAPPGALSPVAPTPLAHEVGGATGIDRSPVRASAANDSASALAWLYACEQPEALVDALQQTPLYVEALPHGLLLRAAVNDTSGGSDVQLLLDEGEVWLCGGDVATLRATEAAVVAVAPVAWRRLPLVELDAAGRPLSIGRDAADAHATSTADKVVVPRRLARC